MKSGLKFLLGTGIMAVLSPGAFAAACTTWTLGDGITSIAPGTSATGTTTGTIPCTSGGDTFSNFYVFNTATSDTNIVVGASFSGSTITFGVTNLDAKTDFDVVFSVAPSQSTVTISGAATTTHIVDTICSVMFIQGQSCTGNGGTVLGGAIVNGSTSVTIPIATSPTGVDYVFEDVSGVTSFSKTFGTPTITPEPVTLPLMGVGLLGLGLIRRRQGQK